MKLAAAFRHKAAGQRPLVCMPDQDLDVTISVLVLTNFGVKRWQIDNDLKIHGVSLGIYVLHNSQMLWASTL